MDIATLVGMFSAFGLVLSAIMMGGGIELFINIPSLMIVAGGTLGATMINYPIKDVIGAISVAKNVFFNKKTAYDKLTADFVSYGNKARREGILALENDIGNIVDNDFLKKGLQMAVDGLEPEAIETIMTTETEFLKNRHNLGAEIFSTMAAFAPALGMIGTLIGLVQMLQSMDDPSSIGPSMAVALLTTFYGSVLANLVFMPMSGKLKAKSKLETLEREIVAEGVMCLASGDNPRIVEQKLMSFLPPKLRVGKKKV